ncbi:MAG: DUF3368 domain-containing protein [Deltaproteobacteria bacterium]|nr:DUF3368 domain-containing protein [Deltaproteobacteria bacterium]
MIHLQSLGLGKSNSLNCLTQLFDTIHIPLAVQDECLDPISSKIIKGPPFEVHKIKTVLNLGARLGLGETEAISLALELNIKTIVIDDKDAFKKASQQGLNPMTSLQVLIFAKQAGAIDSVKKALETMKENGNYVAPDEYLKALRDAGEIPDHSPSPLEDMQPTTSDATLPPTIVAE